MQRGWDVGSSVSSRTILVSEAEPCTDSEEEIERDAFFVGEAEMKSEVQED